MTVQRDHTPIYVTIREQLRAEIAGGRFRAGDRLPSEPEIAQRYGTTRNTVRNAIARLVFEGLIERRVGLGSFVADGGRHESNIDTALRQSFEEQMAVNGIRVRHRLLDFASVACPAPIAAALGIPKGAPVHLFRRLRFVEQDIIGVELRYLLAAVADRIPLTALESSSAIAMVEAAMGTRLSDIEVTVFAGAADAELGRLLGCRQGAAVLTRRHLFRGAAGRPVLFGDACYRGDRYRFTYHLGRDGTAGRFSADGRAASQEFAR